MANKYRIFTKFTEDIIEVEQRKLTIRDGYLSVNGAKIGENELTSLIIPLNSIAFIEEKIETPLKKENVPVKKWRFGSEFPKD